MSAVNSWRKLQKLSLSDLMLLVWALLLLPLTALCVRFFGFRRLYAAMAEISASRKSKVILCPVGSVACRGEFSKQSFPQTNNISGIPAHSIDTNTSGYYIKSVTEVYAIARIVRIANWRGLYRANCLQQSLVLWWLLRCRGIESNLRIGVRKREGKFEAHAWVEYLGIVLNDRSDVGEEFAPFDGAILPLEGQLR